MKQDFSSYGLSFQEGLISLLVHDRAFCEQIREILDINYFEYDYMKIVVEKLFSYKDKYKTHPNNDTITALLNTELKKETELSQKQVKDFFQKICKNEVDNREFIQDKAVDFCKKQVLKTAMLKSVDLLDKSSFDEISLVINNALKLGLQNDTGHDYIADFETRYRIQHRHPISMGWEQIDSIVGGGLGVGELGIVIAPSGIGKSFLLVHFGAQALKAGKNVVHYTLELSDNNVGNRYDSCITGIPLNELHVCKEKVLETIKEIPGRLIVKEYPTKSISTMSIRAHIEKCIQRGFKPDLIIVDYGDLLKATTNYNEKRFELENNFEELRSIGQYYGCPCWSATQTNRLGLSQEVVTLSTISESFAKVFPADLIVCLSRSPDEKAGNQAKLHVAKNRMGPDSIVFPLFFDTSCAKIRVLAEGETAIAEKTQEEKERELKEKYKNYLKKK